MAPRERERDIGTIRKILLICYIIHYFETPDIFEFWICITPPDIHHITDSGIAMTRQNSLPLIQQKQNKLKMTDC